MDDEATGRSLAWTIATAVGTYALLVSTSWRMGVLHGSNSSGETSLDRLMWHAASTLFMPFQTIQAILNQVMTLLVVRGSYLSKGMPFFPALEVPMNHLILSSNLLIEVPPSQDPGPRLRPYLINANTVSAIRPLELTPLYAPDLLRMLPSLSSDNSLAPLLDPLQIGAVDITRAEYAPFVDDLYQEKLYLRLPAPTFFIDETLQDREAMLMCGFTALREMAELCAIDQRARLSRWQALAMVLQAGGYALGVAERWKRGLGVSPVEAILFVFSAPMLIQVLLEPSAARLNYEHPLLLRLHPDQFKMFRDFPRTPFDRPTVYKGHVSSIFLNFSYLVFSYFLLPILSISYSMVYWRVARFCSVPTFLLFLLCTCPLYASTIVSLLPAQSFPLILIGFWQMFLIFLTITFTLWSTIKHWDLFHIPTNPKLAWLLPHFAT